MFNLFSCQDFNKFIGNVLHFQVPMSPLLVVSELFCVRFNFVSCTLGSVSLAFLAAPVPLLLIVLLSKRDLGIMDFYCIRLKATEHCCDSSSNVSVQDMCSLTVFAQSHFSSGLIR